MNYLIGIIVALLGGFLYQKSKRQTAEARNDNLATKEELNNISKEQAKNSGQLESEEQKQSELRKELDKTKQIQDTISSIVDFLNNRNKK